MQRTLYYSAMTHFETKSCLIFLAARRCNLAVKLGFLLASLFVGIPQSIAQIELEAESDVFFELDSRFDEISEETDDEMVELSEEEKAAAQARAIELSRELESRQTAIQNMRSDLGIYAPALQEAYSDLAMFYTEVEDYESAISVYTDALQVARINTGLYSEEQRPIIDSLIENQAELRAWEEVDKLHELDYFVASRIYPVDASAYRLAMESYGAWKLRVVRENILQMTSRGIISTATDLSEFYARVISNIEVQPNAVQESLLVMIQAKAQTDLSLARSIASTPFTAFQGNASPFITETRCQNRPNSQGQLVRQCVNVQVENPRYRQSQRDAKNMALRRYTREIDSSLDRLRTINATTRVLNDTERQMLESRIAELETESVQLSRSGRRLFTF